MGRARSQLSPVLVGLFFCFGFSSTALPEEQWESPDKFEEDFDIDFDASEWEAMDSDDLENSQFEVLDADSGVIEIDRNPTPLIHEAGGFQQFAFYYSSIGYTFQLREDNVVNLLDKNELSAYTNLLKRTLKPAFLSLELGIYPMSMLGVLIKDHQRDFYDDLDYNEDFNLVESLTAGFDEPYSLSLLFHNLSLFNADQAEQGRAPNVAFMGYLFSVGDRHIFQNELIDDLWYELEWKTKGSFALNNEQFDWTLSLGVKNHRNSDIADTAYLKFIKNQIAFSGPLWRWNANTGYEFKYMISRKNAAPTEISGYITKYFPVFKNASYVPAISIGLIRQSERKYSDSFQAEYGEVNEYTISIKPTIVF